MVKLINRVTGGEMWVDEGRVSEYTAAGHQMAVAKTEPVPTSEKPVKKRVVKR